ncbi:MAG: protein translocase subunit SecF [Candidatus Woesearchaeota archaeon]
MGRRERRRQLRGAKSTPVTEQVNVSKPARANVFKNVYENNYKKLLLIPFIILLLSIGVIVFQVATTGDFVSKGISLKGGIVATISTSDITPQELQSFMTTQFPGSEINVRVVEELGVQQALIVESGDVKSTDLTAALNSFQAGLSDQASIEEIGASLSNSFFRQTILAVIIAFIFMSIVVFLHFKTFAPSAAVILAAASDIIITLAVFNLLGMKLSTAGVAAFLMLIGYSVDTDILLSTRVLKSQEGKVITRVYDAMRTGMTMTLTTIAAVIVGLLVSQSDVLHQIMTILLIGLLADIVNTWIQNAGILRWYMEKKNGQS